MDRVRQELLVSVSGGTIAPFTVSFGVAHSDQDPNLEELCRVADAALFRAKREGRDRVVVDSFSHTTDDKAMFTSTTGETTAHEAQPVSVDA